MQFITLIGAMACLAFLFFRYRTASAKSRQRTTRQKLETAHAILFAILALLAMAYQLRTLNHNLDHDPGTAPPPKLLERIAIFFH
jgi:hypothetical protein